MHNSTYQNGKYLTSLSDDGFMFLLPVWYFFIKLQRYATPSSGDKYASQHKQWNNEVNNVLCQRHLFEVNIGHMAIAIFNFFKTSKLMVILPRSCDWKRFGSIKPVAPERPLSPQKNGLVLIKMLCSAFTRLLNPDVLTLWPYNTYLLKTCFFMWDN